jgi:hypothetical protein
MQASKSRDDLDRWDIFGCLSCETTIRETPSGPGSPAGSQDKR